MELTLADLTTRDELNLKARAALQLAVARAINPEPDALAQTFAQRMGTWGQHQVAAWRQKAAVTAMDTTGGLAAAGGYAAALVEAVDRVSVLGALKRAGAIPVPANVVGTLQTGGAAAMWTGEGAAKAVSALSFATTSLPARKLTVMIVMSRELLFVGDSRTQDVVTRSATSAIAGATNSAVLDATAASASRPAGLLNGVSATILSGSIGEQVALVVNALSAGAPARPVVFVSIQTAMRLLATVRDLEAIGITVVVAPEATNRIVGVDATGVLFVDGGLTIAVSDQGDVQLDSAPSEPDTAATIRVSTFQRDLRAIRAERVLNWKARSDAVAWGTIV